MDQGDLLDRAFVCITDATISAIDTDALQWVQFSARPLALAGSGLNVGVGENQLIVDPAIVPYLSNNQTFTGSNTFSGSLTMSGTVSVPSITGLDTPLSTETTKAANVGYVTQQFNGFSYKAPVVAASVANIVLTTLAPGLIVDGYTLIENSRVLLKDQTDPTENGLYRATTALGGVRTVDLPVGGSAYGLFVMAVNGTVNGDQAFVCTDDATVAIADGVNALHFTALVTQATGLAGQGLVQNGRALDVQVDNSTVEISADTIQLKNGGITDAKIAATTITNAKLAHSTVDVATYNGVVTTGAGVTTDTVALGATINIGVDYSIIPGLAQNNTFTATNAFGGANTYTASNTFSGAVTVTSGTAATSQTTGALIVTGGVGISGDLFVSSSYNMSDERLKDNITELGDAALNTIVAMRGCTFTWNENHVNAEVGRVGNKTVGVIAQEVRDAGAPLCVIQNASNDLLAVDYTKLVPYLIESVKALKRKCDAMESEIISSKVQRVAL